MLLSSSGFGGNKGAVTTRIVIEETSMTFVTSHLRAGAEKMHGRNADVKSILTKTLLLQNSNNTLNENLSRPSRQYNNCDLIKGILILILSIIIIIIILIIIIISLL